MQAKIELESILFGKTIISRERDHSAIEDARHEYHVPPLSKTNTILDLGCNIGLTILHYHDLFPDATIVGVDLDEDNINLARRNTKEISSQVRLVHAAVAANNGIRTYESQQQPFAYRLTEGGDTQVRAVTLQSLIDVCGGFAEFVKMDIEGAEFEILTPSADLTRIGSILVEVHNQNKVDDIIQILRGHGFQAERHLIHWSAVWATRLEVQHAN